MSAPESVTYCPHTGKVCHPSRRVAAENLARTIAGFDLRGRDRRQCGKLNVYRCKACGQFHLGNQDPELTRARRERSRRPEREADTDAA